MLMVVTWVGFLIQLYSVGYMGPEEGYWRTSRTSTLLAGDARLLHSSAAAIW